ncbi:MAG: hypothetical protein KGO94_13015, partial [Alphaproteobacteria bacterium]|nr:hypothetical protein [Alphaproteobacteria bacterium]
AINLVPLAADQRCFAHVLRRVVRAAFSRDWANDGVRLHIQQCGQDSFGIIQSLVRLIISAASSNTAWAKPNGCVH